MKCKLVSLSIIFLFSIAIVMGLKFFSHESNKSANHFLRHSFTGFAAQNKVLNLDSKAYNFAGFSANQIYLANERAPLTILIADTALNWIQPKTLENKTGIKISLGLIMIDSPYFYLSDQISHSFLKGNIDTWQLNKLVLNNTMFDFYLPINDELFVVRVFERNQFEYILGEQRTDNSLKLSPNLLDGQGDRVFSVDGMITYNVKLSILTYLYFYRNQFLCIDTNLNLKYKGKTIDTVSTNRFKIAKINSDNSVSLTEFPIIVNKKSCTDDKYLFILSGLKADNEEESLFNNTNVIDVYDLRNGHYQFSFYIPRYKEKEIRDFRVVGKNIFVIADHYLLSYRLTDEVEQMAK